MTTARRNYVEVVADFETTTDPEDCRVWAWGLANVDHDPWFKYGNSIDQFMNEMESFDSYCSFHNLGFDMYFMLDWLFHHDYTYSETPKPGQFKTLIDRMGKVYTIDVLWNTGHRTQFRDSLKRIPMPLAQAAKTFELPVMKGSIDYDAPRPVGHELTPDEVDYLRNDVVILAMALAIQRDEGMKKLTVGSDALAEYKSLMPREWFSARFPLLDVDTDSDIRRAYRGGFTYADPRFSGKVQGSGNVYDVNSLYPYVMYTKPIPFGFPRAYGSLDEARRNMKPGEVFITQLVFGAVLKEDHIPCIQIKGNVMYKATEYQKVIPNGTEMWVSSVDYDLWNDHYDLDIDYTGRTYVFSTATGLFTDYIDKWSAIKRNSTGGRKAIAKLFLNSLYGKFATNPDCTGKIPVMEDNVVKLTMGQENTRDPVYTAAGVFITAYARDITIRAAQQHYDQFAYADTDSLHLLGDPPTDLRIHPSELGAWKHEYHFTRALWARAKAYTEELEDGSLVTHIAGLPREVAQEVTFDDYRNGKVFRGKLTPVRVPGGVVLRDVGFTLARLL